MKVSDDINNIAVSVDEGTQLDKDAAEYLWSIHREAVKMEARIAELEGQVEILTLETKKLLAEYTAIEKVIIDWKVTS